MKINEIFNSFEGEGYFIGYSITCLRLSGCNLECRFCDTEHQKIILDLSAKEVYKKITKLLNSNKSKLLVISGGEPLIQKKELVEFIKMFKEEQTILINTNGTIELPLFKNVFYSISPKINKERIYKKYLNYPNVYFKFLIENKEDMEEIFRFIDKYGYPANTIYVSPEWSIDNEVTSMILNNFKLGEKIRITGQLHKYLGVK